MGSCCWTRDHRLSTLSTWSEYLLKMADIFNISSDPVGPHQELQEEPSEGSHHHLHQGLLHHPGQKRFHWTRPNQEYFPTNFHPHNKSSPCSSGFLHLGLLCVLGLLSLF